MKDVVVDDDDTTPRPQTLHCLTLPPYFRHTKRVARGEGNEMRVMKTIELYILLDTLYDRGVSLPPSPFFTAATTSRRRPEIDG